MRKLNTREKALVLCATLVLTIALLWRGIAQPAWDQRIESFKNIAKYDAIAAMLDQIPTNAGINPPIDSRPPLRQRITSGARAMGLDIRRIEPQGDAVSVVLDDVSFEKLISWLDASTMTDGLRVMSADISRRPEPGLVAARLLLGSDS